MLPAARCTGSPLVSAGDGISPDVVGRHLYIEREVVQLQVLHEDAANPTSLHHVRLALVVERRRQPRRLLRLAEDVVDEEQRVPVAVEVRLTQLLQREQDGQTVTSGGLNLLRLAKYVVDEEKRVPVAVEVRLTQLLR